MAERVNKNRKELKKFKGEQGLKRIFCGPRVQGREPLKLTNKRSVWYLLLLSLRVFSDSMPVSG